MTHEIYKFRVARGRLVASRHRPSPATRCAARIRANIDTLSDAEVVERIDGGEPSSDSTHDFIRWGVTNGFWTEERAQRMLAAFPDKPGALPRRSYPPSWRGRIEQAEGFANAGLITPGQVADVLR